MTESPVPQNPVADAVDGARPFAGRTVLMSGGSRGIGLAIALELAAGGANIALMAKTATAQPTLEGTVYTAAEQIRAHGVGALPIVGDVRNDDDVQSAVEATVAEFGGIDMVVNNASAIDLSTTDAVSMKRYDLMHDINVRGTFLLSKLSLDALRRSENPHILTLSPPLNLDPKWAGANLAYTMAKYGMSMTTLGLAEELRGDGIAVNSLWPATLINTAAIRNMPGGEQLIRGARKEAIVSDAAAVILARPASECSGNFFIDEEVLRGEGVTDFTGYSMGAPEDQLVPDMFL
ncbi:MULTISPECIES: SDR family oxidoreductase [Micrococcaceae]|uniref:Short-chain dehydrogenase/reductase SDR n=1 Tax=Arthrobacter rhombi TaxID=71253 RepID=A0A1R4GUE3_9MICC|nr:MULTISPECIES: NAD(P)-dependent oxidoreductase [Micrococcaceae]PCC26691.1 NAD(P)-dependent oxidoreductase [Glutamicibacter sp. BW78]SJM71818.1 Short-chain dehydrogenase/reductase SDR [Arthrobacter rhombi]